MKKDLFLFSLFTLLSIIDIKSQWNPVNGLPLGEFSHIYSLNDTLYVGKNNILYLSTDFGSTWSHTNPIKSEVDFISAIIKVDNNLFVGTYNQGVFKSTDNGITWSSLNNGLTGAGSLDIKEFALRGDSLYIGTIGASIFVIPINGNKWFSFNKNIPMNSAGTVFSLFNFNERLISGSGLNANIYINDNGSANWNGITFTQFSSNGTALLGLINKNNILFGVGSQGLYVSSDSGLIWESFNPGHGLIDGGNLVLVDQGVLAMLAKSNATYYYNCDKINNVWTLFDFQPGVLTYNFVVINNKIFAARVDGLYHRELNTTSVEHDNNIHLMEFKLFQNYPNPFNPSTVINYNVPKEGIVTLKIYNLLGQEVVTLLNKQHAAGSYKATFNALQFPSGVYFYRLKSNSVVLTKKMLLLK